MELLYWYLAITVIFTLAEIIDSSTSGENLTLPIIILNTIFSLLWPVSVASAVIVIRRGK